MVHPCVVVLLLVFVSLVYQFLFVPIFLPCQAGSASGASVRRVAVIALVRLSCPSSTLSRTSPSTYLVRFPRCVFHFLMSSPAMLLSFPQKLTKEITSSPMNTCLAHLEIILCSAEPHQSGRQHRHLSRHGCHRPCHYHGVHAAHSSFGAIAAIGSEFLRRHRAAFGGTDCV
jgi:hypothetical protein